MPQLTLGLRSSSGRRRLTVASSITATALKAAIQKEMALENQNFVLRRDENGRPGPELHITRTASLGSLGLRSGDVLYITPKQGTRLKPDEEEASQTSVTVSNASTTSSTSDLAAMDTLESTSKVVVVEDTVDTFLSGESGRIEVGITPQCQHKATSQKCLYCASVEPYDEAYLKQEGIKYMSFHSYLRKLKSGVSGGKYAALEDVRCTIKEGCTSHKPWPKGICSKCQPPAVTLNMQKYRHVDHIQFENAAIVDQFLAYWRMTNSQRIGYLYGRYEHFPDVPLGVKAVVSAIYEPPQECYRDSIKLVESAEEEARVESLAKNLGLRRVGWIFTDLIADSKGNVRHIRKADNHFLSAQECITAGHYQSQFPNPCKYASQGTFGSKFVTVVVTGNEKKEVHMEGYQVSNQGMALARDKVLIPTKDAPELGYVLESSDSRYVPDVFFKEKDKYGNEVTKLARPLPVEYLLIDVPVATPKTPESTFYQPAEGQARFPIENRPMQGHLQEFSELAKYRVSCPDLIKFFRDFHLLLYLATQTVSPIALEFMKPLLEAIRDEKHDAVLAWSTSEHWQTIELLLEAHNEGMS